jgi:hypothetical protein
MDSPYLGLSVEELESKTKDLIRQHPLDSNEIYKVVIDAWDQIFQSSIGSKGYLNTHLTALDFRKPYRYCKAGW